MRYHFPVVPSGESASPLPHGFVSPPISECRVLKILLLLAVGLIAYAVLKKYSRSVQGPPSKPQVREAEDMVRCAHCGVNLPRSEAIYSKGEFYCTVEHQKLGKK